MDKKYEYSHFVHYKNDDVWKWVEEKEKEGWEYLEHTMVSHPDPAVAVITQHPNVLWTSVVMRREKK